MMIGGRDRPEIEHELVEVQVFAELPFFDRDLGGAPQGFRVVPLNRDQVVACGARLVVQFCRNCVENAPSRKVILPPLHAAFEDRSNTGLASRLLECWSDHDVDEPLASLLQDLKLELLFRPEVSEEPALGHPRRAGECTNRELVETDSADEFERLVDDGSFGFFAFRHDCIIVRPFVLSME